MPLGLLCSHDKATRRGDPKPDLLDADHPDAPSHCLQPSCCLEWFAAACREDPGRALFAPAIVRQNAVGETWRTCATDTHTREIRSQRTRVLPGLRTTEFVS